MGAAYLAGLAVGFWRDQAEIRKIWAVDRTFEPQLDAKSRDARLHGWHRAVQRAFDWAKEEYRFAPPILFPLHLVGADDLLGP